MLGQPFSLISALLRYRQSLAFLRHTRSFFLQYEQAIEPIAERLGADERFLDSSYVRFLVSNAS